MPANKHFKDLPDQLLRVSSSKKGYSSVELTERIKKFYRINCAPSQPTVWRAIQKLVSENEMYESDDGYKKKDSTRYSLRTFKDVPPRDLLWNELAMCLLVLADDPIENAPHIKEIVETRIASTLNGMRVIIELVDLLLQSPEIVAHMAHSDEGFRKMLKQYNEDDPDWRENFWNARDTYGEYTITTRQEEIP